MLFVIVFYTLAQRPMKESPFNLPCLYHHDQTQFVCCLTFRKRGAELLALCSMSFQYVSPQTACPHRGKVTLITFVCLYPRVNFQMRPQIPCPSRCVIALVALVWFFSRMGFQMYLQCARSNRRIITKFAFEFLFFGMSFQMCFQTASISRCIVT